MNFYLSPELEVENQKYQAQINELQKEYEAIVRAMGEIRSGQQGGTLEQRQIDILRKQIEIDENGMKIEVKQSAITKLYIQQIENALAEKRRSNQISATQYSGEKRKLDYYREMEMIISSINDFSSILEILEKNLRTVHLKRNLKMISPQEAEKEIEKITLEMQKNEQYREDEENELSQKMIEYYSSNLHFLRNTGEITTEQLQEALASLDELKGKYIHREQVQAIFDQLKKDHLQIVNPVREEEENHTQKQTEEMNMTTDSEEFEEYERQISDRDRISLAMCWEKAAAQDMNKTHETNIYYSVQTVEKKIEQYNTEAIENNVQDSLIYIGEKLGEDYAANLAENEAELARKFALLEIQGRQGYFINPYARLYETSGYQNPKLLLQLEQVEGINIQELEDTIGLDTSVLREQIYIATYEIEDEQTGKKRPIKEYYRKNEAGEMILIGEETEEIARFTIDGADLSVAAGEIKPGNQIATFTQKKLADKVMKQQIQTSINCGRITEIAEITDLTFIDEISTQCLLEGDENPISQLFIVSSIDQDGNEQFDVVSIDSREARYSRLEELYDTEKNGRKIFTTTGQQFQGGLAQITEAKTLKEYMTPSGHRYAITRNETGKLGINEIYRETQDMIRAQHVDTYTLNLDDLMLAYSELGIRDEDLQKAYQEINRAQNQRSGQTEKKDTER